MYAPALFAKLACGKSSLTRITPKIHVNLKAGADH
jgi:hypothetical protein